MQGEAARQIDSAMSIVLSCIALPSINQIIWLINIVYITRESFIARRRPVARDSINQSATLFSKKIYENTHDTEHAVLMFPSGVRLRYPSSAITKFSQLLCNLLQGYRVVRVTPTDGWHDLRAALGTERAELSIKLIGYRISERKTTSFKRKNKKWA